MRLLYNAPNTSLCEIRKPAYLAKNAVSAFPSTQSESEAKEFAYERFSSCEDERWNQKNNAPKEKLSTNALGKLWRDRAVFVDFTELQVWTV